MTDCTQVPTLDEIYQAKKNITDLDAFANSTADTFVDSDGVTKATLTGIIGEIGFTDSGLEFSGGGGTLLDRKALVFNPADDYFYQYIGSLPSVIVPAAPDINWMQFLGNSHAFLAGLNPADGSAHNSDDINFTNYVDQTAKFKQYVGGGGPVGISTRDPFLVSRELTGQTDCHAFADNTKISNATDSGTYGTFDSTTEIAGTHNQSHQFSFQDRAKFSGSGTLGTWGNIVWPVMSGGGTVTTRYDMWLKDVAKTGGGTINTHIGIFMENLANANSNSAMTLLQSNGYTCYAPNAGGWVLGGATEIKGTTTHRGTTLLEGATYLGGNTKAGGYSNGTAPLSGVALTVEKNGLATQGFVDVNSVGLSFGVIGDKKLQFVTNAVSRWSVADAAGGYALLPAGTTPDIASASFRIGTLFATNAVNVSDAREKQQVRDVTEAEKLAARELKDNIIGYKWNQAVERKGDGARWHFGWIAQRVKEIMEKHGFDAFEYGFLCFDEWDDIYEDVQTNIGEKQLKTVENEYKREQQKFSIVPTKEMVKVKKIIDGNEVIVLENQIVDKIVYEFNSYPVFNGDGTPALDDEGNPIIEREPIMETIIDKSVNTYEVDADPIYEKVLVKPAGNIYGINHNDIFAFILSAY